MKYRVQPTPVERIMRDDDFIVSKTDLKGNIIYGNRIFAEFSGFPERELIGRPHNIIRHPHMPRGVFRVLWEAIQAKRECFAYVKNMARDGSFYWVFANVTPSFDPNGRCNGYYSVRRKPRKDAIALIEGVYRSMLDIEAKEGARNGCSASLAYLNDLLAEKGVSYEEFVLTI